MPRIFICYRRDDSAGISGRIYDRLATRFGRENVVMDIDVVPLGVDFRKFLHGEVDTCNVLLAVIGRKWFGRTPKRGRRLDGPKDFVRIEIEAALAKGIPIIPVLIDGVRMPSENELPSSIADLAYLNAIEIDPGRDFHLHMDRLVRGIERLGTTDVEFVTNSIGMKLVLIPAGEFLMGSPDSDQGARDDEKPQHRVRITQPFYLGAHQVTQGQYQAVMGENPSQFKGSDDLPVEFVSWEDAVAFCNKLSEREGLKPFYQSGRGSQSGGGGYRLPTEAEWEYACRAGGQTRFSFGGDDASLAEYAWFVFNSFGKTHPVGQKRANAFGLYDVHGNVWEWCGDGNGADCYPHSPDADPAGPPGAEDRVDRGGSWSSFPQDCRAANRNGGRPGFRNHDLGFRVARARSSADG
jgi:formylglycine-generating enzyme required for sulfatase activity